MTINKPKISKSVKSILSTAKTLFWKHGIKKVSVEEICETAGVSKMTFYRNFSNKEELAIRILDDFIQISQAKYNQFMDDENLALSEKIEKIIALKREGAKDMSVEFMQDIYKNDFHSLQKYIAEQQVKSRLTLQNFLKKGQEKGEIRAGLKIPFIMEMLDIIQQKSMDENFLKGIENNPNLISDLISFFFYGIAGK
jgi:AcrR family transcriptional regulator